MKRLFCLTLSMVCCAVAAGSCQAQFGNPLKRFEEAARKEAGRASDAVKGAHAMNYHIRIGNPGNSPVKYTFEGAPFVLPAHTIRSHSGSKIGRPVLVFDNGRNQNIEYGLDGNRTFDFRWNNGVLDLFRQ